MACDTVTTGRGFLAETLNHLDCQAQSIGEYGFGSLARPGSAAATLIALLLTLFIAVYAVRLLTGRTVDRGDLVGAILKIGIVLTLAFSWPAFRPLVYDTVLFGPAEIAGALATPDVPSTQSGFATRLQRLDDGLASLAVLGPGRQVGALENPAALDESFRSIALDDDTGLGFGRTIYLAATIGTIAVLRIAGGLLLALTPLFAGLLFFDASRGLFSGWLRGLVLVALGSIGISLLLAVQMAVMEPWLIDVLDRRQAGYATPNAPTELLALALAFGIAAFVLLALLTRVAFQNSWPLSVRSSIAAEPVPARASPTAPAIGLPTRHAEPQPTSRALLIRESVASTLRREEMRTLTPVLADSASARSGTRDPDSARATHSPSSGGNASAGVGRAARRISRAGTHRDNRT